MLICSMGFSAKNEQLKIKSNYCCKDARDNYDDYLKSLKIIAKTT